MLMAAGTFVRDASGQESPAVRSMLQLKNPAVKDQDDMCVWRDGKDPSRSTIITSDKSANSLFVYDLAGELLQEISVPKPGNIDIRHQVEIEGRQLDIVVVNQRASGFKLCAYAVEPESRALRRLDDEQLLTGPNYGGCLYHSRRTGHLYFFCTSDQGAVEQHELSGNGQGGLRNTKVRSWPLGKCESAVADDDSGTLYISEEAKGIWKMPAESDDVTPAELIIKVGEHGMKGDVEGLGLDGSGDHGKTLIVSDQGRSRFMIYQRTKPYTYVGEFSIEGASQTDGIDVVAGDFGPSFPRGIFACHTDKSPRAILVTPLHEIFAKLPRPNAVGDVPR